jgi:hypothetical protein
MNLYRCKTCQEKATYWDCCVGPQGVRVYPACNPDHLSIDYTTKKVLTDLDEVETWLIDQTL